MKKRKTHFKLKGEVAVPQSKLPMRGWGYVDFGEYTSYTIKHANGQRSSFDITAPGFVDSRVKVAYGLVVKQTVRV